MPRTQGLIKVPSVIGLPPSTYVSDNMVINSIPIATITPCVPSFQLGMSIFQLNEDEGWRDYSRILNAHGFTATSPINVAFLADNFPTDSFTNEYGESFLQRFTDVASSGAAAISQFFGGRDAGKTLSNISEALKAQGGTLGMVGGGMQEAVRQMEQLKEAFAKTGPAQAAVVNRLGGMIGKLMTGARIDFPQVWKNSGFTPSYTMTVRLYNPRPGNSATTKEYIIGPLAALILLGIPISTDGDTYNWPFLHKISCPGIYHLNPAFIGNITVVKGGDQQQISHRQKMGIVDVRIDFGSLYNSILAEEGSTIPHRPTLRTYLKALEGGKKLYDVKNLPSGVRAGGATLIEATKNVYTARKSQPSSNFETEVQPRVSTGDKNLAANLENMSELDAAGFVPTT